MDNNTVQFRCFLVSSALFFGFEQGCGVVKRKHFCSSLVENGYIQIVSDIALTCVAVCRLGRLVRQNLPFRGRSTPTSMAFQPDR